MQKLTKSEYAKYKNVKVEHVFAAVSRGAISLDDSGLIDPEIADVQWQQSKYPPLMNAAEKDSESSEHTEMGEIRSIISKDDVTYVEARTANEIIKAKTSKVLLEKISEELIDKANVEMHVFARFRQIRDSWSTWPCTIANQIANKFSIDENEFLYCLENYVNEHLAQLSEMDTDVEIKEEIQTDARVNKAIQEQIDKEKNLNE